MTQNLRPFPQTLIVENGDSDYNTSTKLATLVEAAGSGAMSKIWQFTVPAQQGIRWGYGTPATQFNQGIISLAFADSGTGFTEGMIEFRVTNAAGTVISVVERLYSGTLHGSTNTNALAALEVDRNRIPPFPERDPIAFEDSRLEIWFRKIIDAGTVDSVAFTIPATVYA